MLTCPHCSHPLVLLSAHDPLLMPVQVSRRPVDLDDTLQRYLATVRTTDVLAATVHLFDVEHPARALQERVRRMLDRLVAAGTVSKAPGRPGGQGGGVPTVYTLNAPG